LIKANKIFFIIVLIAIFLRFYKLGQIPAGLNWDENSNAYNAYSILKTARDEYGNFLPLYNRSFDDYKPPIYMYLNVPTIAIFSLTPLAARLPSAFLGVLTVIAMYYFTKRIFQNESVALGSMFLLAISPWHLQFSRVGFEANVGLFFAIASFTLILYSLIFQNDKPSKRNYLLLLISAVFFGLSFYTYHSDRIFIPAIFIVFSLIFRKELLRFPKKIIITFFILIAIIVMPYFILAPTKAILNRLESTSLETTVKNVDESVKLISEDKEAGQNLSNIIHNRRILIARSYLANYLTHFDLNFLFTSGDDNLRHHTEGMGMLFLYQLPLLLLSIYLIIQKRTKETLFLVSWLLLSPLPAVPTNAVPHAVRSFSMVIALQAMCALAFVHLQERIKQKLIFYLVTFLIISITTLTYLHNYYKHYPIDHSAAWQYGYKEAALASIKLKNNYDKVIIDPSLEQAYIFWLFNSKYDPKLYQTQGSKEHFDKFYFNDNTDPNPKNLYIYTQTMFPNKFKTIETIYDPLGKEIIKLGYTPIN